jgi:hypothetical protein
MSARNAVRTEGPSFVDCSVPFQSGDHVPMAKPPSLLCVVSVSLPQVVSVLFFVISELADVEPMYQYSLAWFVGLFEATLVQAEKARELHKRIDNLLQHFQYSLYLKVCSNGQAAAGKCQVLPVGCVREPGGQSHASG